MFMTYNPAIVSGSNITGWYSKLTDNLYTSHYIMVNEREVEMYKNNPNNFRIDNKKFNEIHRSEEEAALVHVMRNKSSAKSSILSPIVVDDVEYIPDIPFQLNLSTGLHLLANKTVNSIMLMGKKDDQWTMLEHDKDMLLAIARELNARRESISLNLYKQESE